MGHRWGWSLALFIFSLLLNLVLGSKSCKVACQAVLQPKLTSQHGVGGTLLVYFVLMMLAVVPMFYGVVAGNLLKQEESNVTAKMQKPSMIWLGSTAVVFILGACVPLIEIFTQIFESQPLQKGTPELQYQLEDESKSRSSEEMPLPKFKIFWRYVTRGNNPTLVKENLLHSLDVLKSSVLPSERWAIEVVTDKRIEGLSNSKLDLQHVTQIVVPDDYICPNGAKYKARALHFATCHLGDRKVFPHDYDWIVHLDEETRCDVHTVASIFEFCYSENVRTTAGNDGWCNMAQGVIVYNCFAHVIENPLMAIADCQRVAGDYGKFLFASKLVDRPVIGMHGSFVVANQALERETGFDFGITGSITEDFYLAFKCWHEKNVKVKRLESFMFEQSPFNAVDLIRQRARWFQGNVMCIFAPEFPLYITFIGMCALVCQVANVLLWALSPLCFLSMFFDFLRTAMPATLYAAGLMCAYYAWIYCLGFILSFNPRSPVEGGMGVPMWLTLLFLLIIFQPVFALIETLGTLWGTYLWLSQRVEFYIVKKELTNQKLLEVHKKGSIVDDEHL